MTNARDTIKSQIRRVLLEDWDPHDALRRPEAHGTYDAYVEPLAALLSKGADEEAVIDWLADREQETMCFPSLGRERLRRVARRLVGAASGEAG
jgi:hypothetical protein